MAFDYSGYFNDPGYAYRELGSGYDPSQAYGGGGYNSPFLDPRATSGDNSVPYVDYRQESPGQANRENRANFANWGQSMDQSLGGQMNEQNGLQNYYRQPMNAAYGDLAQTPGYTDQEMQNISRYPQLQSGMMTPDEASAVRGNTASYGQYFNPDLMRSINASQATLQRNHLTEGQQGLTNATGDLIRDYGNALSPDLAMSGDYTNQMNSALNTGASNVRGAIDRNNLTLDPTLKNDYLMSDRELQGIQDKAGNAARLSREAGYSDIYRRALAGGNADPMALAALRQETDRNAARDAGDASLNAYLAGRNEQANRRMNLEQARLGAEQGYSGLASSNEQQIANRGVGAAQDMENTRLGAAQDLSNRRIQTSGDVANRRMNASQWGAEQGMNLEGNIGNTMGGTEQYITNTGTGINQSMDQNNSDRAYNLMNTRFNQNTGVEDRQSQANTNAANARINGQNNFRNWATDQTNATADRAGAYAGQRIQAGNASMGNQNQATGQWGDYDMQRRNSGFGAAFKKALGTTLGSPQFAF